MPFVQTNPVIMADNTASAFVIKEGSNVYDRIDTVNSSEVRVFSIADVTIDQTLTVSGSNSLTIADYVIHSGDANTYMGFSGADTQVFVTGGTTRMTIDSSGNVGIGAIPKGTNSTHTSITLGGNGYFIGDTTQNPGKSIAIAQNAIYDTDGSWEYISTDEATRYSAAGGSHFFSVAESGTGGADISWTIAMEIDKVGSVTISEAGPHAIAGSVVIASDLTLASGSITSASGAISFGNENLSTTGTFGSGAITSTGAITDGAASSFTTGTTIGNLTLADGSITDSSGAISFGNENLSTTGFAAVGVAALDTNSTLGLTVNQAGNDDIILALQSTDVTQSYTTLADQDTYASFQKISATLGGLLIRGFEDAAGTGGGVQVSGLVGADGINSAGVVIDAAIPDGTGKQAMSTGALCRFTNDGTVQTAMRANGSLAIGSGATGTLDSNMTTGITMHQGAADNLIVALQSSDVSHPFTTYTDADTFSAMKKRSSTLGGLELQALSDASGTALFLNGLMETASTNITSPVIYINACEHDGGGGEQAIGDDDYLLSIGNCETEVVAVTGDGAIENPKVKITALGGIAVKLYNRTGANTVAGQLVKTDTATDDGVILTAADGSEPIGVFLDSGVADDALAWVVVSGIADVALGDNEAATHGYWVRTNTTEAGYAEMVSAPSAVSATHFKEVGHSVETVSAGGAGTHILARCVLHFN